MLKREQTLDIDGHNIILTNMVNDDDLVRANYEERKEIGKGFTQGKTMMKVASIPTEVLLRDYDGWIFYYSKADSPEGKVALKRFLDKHPEYRCSDGRL